MSHVFARLVGYGLTLVPIWPYTFTRPAPDTVTVTHWAAETVARSVTPRQ